MTPRKSILFVCLALTGTMLASCGPSDVKLQKQVNDELAAEVPGVMADVASRKVTLTGEVQHDSLKMKAESIAKDIKGVKSVTNNVIVAQQPLTDPMPVDTAGDARIRKSVDSALAAKGVSGITVTVASGQVTLTGEIAKGDLRKAMEAANEAKPTKIVNSLTVK